MKKVKIESSTIDNISYNTHQRILIVEFTRGAVYRYNCVDVIDVVGMIFAESSGSYFNKHIAKNYSYVKVSG